MRCVRCDVRCADFKPVHHLQKCRQSRTLALTQSEALTTLAGVSEEDVTRNCRHNAHARANPRLVIMELASEA